MNSENANVFFFSRFILYSMKYDSHKQRRQYLQHKTRYQLKSRYDQLAKGKYSTTIWNRWFYDVISPCEIMMCTYPNEIITNAVIRADDRGQYREISRRANGKTSVYRVYKKAVNWKRIKNSLHENVYGQRHCHLIIGRSVAIKDLFIDKSRTKRLILHEYGIDVRLPDASNCV